MGSPWHKPHSLPSSDPHFPCGFKKDVLQLETVLPALALPQRAGLCDPQLTKRTSLRVYKNIRPQKAIFPDGFMLTGRAPQCIPVSGSQ